MATIPRPTSPRPTSQGPTPHGPTSRGRREDRTIRATIDAHAPHARQEFRAGLTVVALFLVGLAIIFSVQLPG